MDDAVARQVEQSRAGAPDSLEPHRHAGPFAVQAVMGEYPQPHRAAGAQRRDVARRPPLADRAGEVGQARPARRHVAHARHQLAPPRVPDEIGGVPPRDDLDAFGHPARLFPHRRQGLGIGAENREPHRRIGRRRVPARRRRLAFRRGSEPEDGFVLAPVGREVGRLPRVARHADILADEAPQLRPAQDPVSVGVGLAPHRPGEQPAERAARAAGSVLVGHRDFGHRLVLLRGRQEVDVRMFRAGGVGRAGRRIEGEHVVVDGVGRRVPEDARRRARVQRARQCAGVAGIGDEDHARPALARLEEPKVYLVVEKPFAGPGAGLGEAAEQQHFVASVGFAARHALRLLSSVPGIAEHQGVARFRTREQAPPFRPDPRPRRLAVLQQGQVLEPRLGEGGVNIPRIGDRSFEVRQGDVFVDADGQSAHRRRFGRRPGKGNRERPRRCRREARAGRPRHRTSSTRRSMRQRSSWL